jgi:methanogenic corrinoid protein MtbC1
MNFMGRRIRVSAHAFGVALAMALGPAMLLAAQAASFRSEKKMLVRVVNGTVKGDLHDIGKNIVASMLEGSGFEVIDLGTDVSPEMFVATVQERKPQPVCMSPLLTVTMPAMKALDALQSAGLRSQVKVLVGGAPVTSQYAAEIGADGYSENASGPSVSRGGCWRRPDDGR